MRHLAAAAGLVVAASLAAAGSARAQPAIEQFYAGRTVTIVVGSAPGGGADIYGRLVARHIGRHIPGRPGVIAANMPGAGGIVGASHLYAIAPKDGTAIGTVLAGAIVEPMLSAGSRRAYDPTRFQFIGNANTETQICIARADAPVRSFAEVFTTELVVGGTGTGATITDYPQFARNVLGARIRLISGYQGLRDVTLAMQRGEVHGVCGINYSSAKLLFPGLTAGRDWRILVQEDVTALPELRRLGVPLMVDFARREEDRSVLAMFYAQGAINRAFMLPPEVPAERVAALRAAFMSVMADPELVAEAARMSIDIAPTSGEQVQDFVARLFASPASVVERTRKAIEGGR